MSDMNGKTVLVTGGARNVGASVTKEFSRRGATVIINYFHAHDSAVRLRDELSAAGGSVHLIRASVAKADQCERMFDEIRSEFGHLDILVNNAADGALRATAEVTDDDLDRALSVNLKGSLRCSRLAADIMPAGSAIVMVSALGSSSMVMANYLACAPAKAAEETMARYLAVDLADRGIRVNVASAAMLRSEVADKFPDAASMQSTVRAATPLARLGEPEELAKVIAFLASSDAGWITGQVILADGGLSLGANMLAPGTTEPPASIPTTAAITSPTDTPDDDDRIAVVGMGLTVAGANSPDEFWNLRIDGSRELFVPVPESRWERRHFFSQNGSDEDKSYQDHCVFITDFVAHEGSETPSSGDTEEFTTAWLRHSLVQALNGVTVTDEDSFSFNVGYTPDGSQHLEEAGVLIGARQMVRDIAEDLDLPARERDALTATASDALSARYHRGRNQAQRFLPHQVGYNAMRGVLPDTTDLQMIDTACSSSLYAVDIGAKGLMMGRQDIAVCGGAFALGPRGTVLFSKLQGLSKNGEVHSLDASADGVIFADGAAVVVLKKLSRARVDGDTVLGVLEAFGTSSDGKGKAVYAPNSEGQDLAVRRAYERNDLRAADIGWVNAHATGTPTGDIAEFSVLRKHYGVDSAAYVTSNKSLIGHTGWAAGVVSLIECLVGMREGRVPAQARFESAPAAFKLDESRLDIPRQTQQWGVGGQRRAAISGFGFGGTNAHLVVGEPSVRITASPPSPAPDSRVAIVGWSAHLPELDDLEAIASWVRSGTPATPSFGNTYPAPPFKRVKLPPPTVRTVDRCQLMIIECAHRLRAQITDFWDEHAMRTGVVVGHLGPTRAAMLNAYRCYRDDIGSTLSDALGGQWSDQLGDIDTELSRRIRATIPASNEDSFPGMMPNIISARVANYFDLRGPNMTVDSGFASTLSAIETASRYVRTGEIDLALVGGINGNSLTEYRHILGDLCAPGTDLSEGAFLFALADENAASAAGLPILGYLGDFSVSDGAGSADAATIECGVNDPDQSQYLGAAGALGLLRALHGQTRHVALTATGDRPGAVSRLDVEICVANADSADAPDQLTHRDQSHTVADETAGTQTAHRPPPDVAAVPETASTVGTPEPTVARHVPYLVEEESVTVGDPVPFLPDDAVVITDMPESVAELIAMSSATGVRIIVPGPRIETDATWITLDTIDADGVRDALGGGPVEHIRVVTNIDRHSASGHAVSDELLGVHDLAFLALQEGNAHVSQAGASVVFLSLAGVDGGVPRAGTGLFSGLVKSVHLELPQALVLHVLTHESDLPAAARQTESETGLAHPMPIIALTEDGRRLGQRLVAESARPERLTLDEGSVVLALGGARGITAEVLVGLAEKTRSRIYLLGSNDLEAYPDEVFHGSDAEFAATRSAFISDGRKAGRGPVGRLNREFERRIDARAAKHNIDRMARFSGPRNVVYMTCDARSSESVDAAVREVLHREGVIDLVVNAAGKNHSARIKDKSLDEFRSVRDLKVLAYRNLKDALHANAPRMWCNFGSLLGYFGQVGESDYASANDLLATAATANDASDPSREFTIGWTLWDGVGMGASELTKAYYEREGSYSHMPIAEGVEAFLAELGLPEQGGLTVHLGDAERRTVEKFYPGYLGPPAGPNSGARSDTAKLSPEKTSSPGFYLRSVLGLTANDGTWECDLDLDTDDYLGHHRVRDVPTLPGMFVTEFAAEAGRALVPGAVVIGVENLTFHHFLRVAPGRSQPPRRIRATIAGTDGDVTRVDVSIVGDVVSPSGITLVRDKLHFSATALMAADFPSCPSWESWDDVGQVPVPDPYHQTNSPIALSGLFECSHDTRVHPLGKRSVFAPHRLTPAFDGQFTTPVVLLDAMARTGILTHPENGSVPIAAPLSVRRIDLYQSANDAQLFRGRGPLDIYATPAGFDMDADRPRNRAVAVDTRGDVVAQIKDISATVVDQVAVAPLPAAADTFSAAAGAGNLKVVR